MSINLSTLNNPFLEMVKNIPPPPPKSREKCSVRIWKWLHDFCKIHHSKDCQSSIEISLWNLIKFIAGEGRGMVGMKLESGEATSQTLIQTQTRSSSSSFTTITILKTASQMNVAQWIVVHCWQYAPYVVPDIPQTCPRWCYFPLRIS